MTLRFRSAGVNVRASSRQPAWQALLEEACAGQALPATTDDEPCDVDVLVDPDGFPDLAGLSVVTRGAFAGQGRVVVLDACGSGLDVQVGVEDEVLRVVARPRPTWRHRGLGLLAPDRRVLLHRAVLLQYPALWWAGVRGLAPLHVCAATVDGVGVVLAGPGGVGKSTLLATLAAGDTAVSDNVCTAEPGRVHGLLEPVRDEHGQGRRMPHGRRERAWRSRSDSLVPQRVIVLRRGETDRVLVRPASPAEAARQLVAGTYAAGELRRYWAFAATLALGLGRGPAHPPVAAVSEAMARAIPCSVAVLPSAPRTSFAELVRRAEGADGVHVVPEAEPVPVDAGGRWS